MKQRILIPIIACLLFVTFGAFAQTDSLVLVSARWQTQKIAKGIVWKQFLFKGDLFGSNQSINILEIEKSKRIDYTIGYNTQVVKLTSEFGKEAAALAAVNGTFFDIKKGGSVDFIKTGGRIVQVNQFSNWERAFHQKAAVVISKGKLKIEKWNGRAEWETELQEKEIMVSGPLLIYRQLPESLDSSSFNITRHPRTAVVVIASNKILLITVDGRNENAAGMNLFELRNMVRWLNAKEAINLDGGGSTTLWINNQPENGVVNFPCDNRKWDHAGERKVANVLLVKKK
jgi:exopolysaccharide biosynthesis protein